MHSLGTGSGAGTEGKERCVGLLSRRSVNVTVSFEIEGVARRQLKQSDALKEQTQFVNMIWHQKKKKNSR